jgi:hypothetical protein
MLYFYQSLKVFEECMPIVLKLYSTENLGPAVQRNTNRKSDSDRVAPQEKNSLERRESIQNILIPG